MTAFVLAVDTDNPFRLVSFLILQYHLGRRDILPL